MISAGTVSEEDVGRLKRLGRLDCGRELRSNSSAWQASYSRHKIG